jgi:hypothetical protein
VGFTSNLFLGDRRSIVLNLYFREFLFTGGVFMTSKYIYVNFPHLKIKNAKTPKGSNCEICRNSNNKTCDDCIYSTGNSKLKDNFYPSGTVLVMRGQNIKRTNYYDKTVSALLSWNGELKQVEDNNIERYRQW